MAKVKMTPIGSSLSQDEQYQYNRQGIGAREMAPTLIFRP